MRGLCGLGHESDDSGSAERFPRSENTPIGQKIGRQASDKIALFTVGSKGCDRSQGSQAQIWTSNRTDMLVHVQPDFSTAPPVLVQIALWPGDAI
jgi:hypothetical protein